MEWRARSRGDGGEGRRGICGLALSSFTFVLRSLTPNAQAIYLLLARYQLDNKDQTYQGMIPREDRGMISGVGDRRGGGLALSFLRSLTLNAQAIFLLLAITNMRIKIRHTVLWTGY